jgi:glycosyltransferase involved in cell wall biosynthesis
LFGDGPERSSVSGEVAHLALNDSVTLGDRTEYEAILAVSSLYISTQILENFSSLAMLEAMAAGNAVVAQNVGQTREFVRDSSNGILVEGAGAEDFGRALVRYFSQEDRDGLGRESRRIAENEHCVANVMDDFEAYWDEVLDLARACGHRVDG